MPGAHPQDLLRVLFTSSKAPSNLFNGTTWVHAKAGDFLHVPEGGIYGFHNDSDADASMIILFTPGAPRERYFEELADIAARGRTLSTAEWIELWARHDQYPA